MSDLINYKYRAQNPDGKIVKGILEASNQNGAVQKLRLMKLMPIEISEQDTTGLNMEINLTPKKVKLGDLALMTRQLASMLTSGLPLIRALSSVQGQTKNKTLKKALQNVLRDVEAGSSLSSAMEKQDGLFPEIMVGMIRVGETGGFLDESLTSLADNLEDDVDLRSKIKSAMAYPMVVSIMAVAGIATMLVFVVPMFVEMFASMNAELPLPTKILIAMSENAPIGLSILAVFGVLYWLLWPRYKNRKEVKRVLDPIKLKTPIIGKIYHKILISRFAKNISTMLNSGVPLMQSLNIVGETAGNYVLEKAIEDITNDVKAGKSISKPLEKNEIFPYMLVQMVSVGEDSGNLEEMFKNVAEFYDKEVKTTTEKLTSIIEPLLIVVMGVVIGGMVISLYMPMFSMYGNLNS